MPFHENSAFAAVNLMINLQEIHVPHVQDERFSFVRQNINEKYKTDCFCQNADTQEKDKREFTCKATKYIYVELVLLVMPILRCSLSRNHLTISSDAMKQQKSPI